MFFKKFLYINLLILLFANICFAISPADYKDRFEIDMASPIPPIEELYQKYAPPSSYDRKYDYYWKIGTKFDKSFAQTIKAYGTREKRLKWDSEETLIKSLENMPEKYYPYIGPYLHSVAGIPDKVLNMPGIKETKNQFPKVIAKKVADIENIEFLSPVLYMMLMPEAWGEVENIERVKPIVLNPSNNYNSDFLDKVMVVVPPKNFAPNADVKESYKSNLRTIYPNKNSPLTSKDIGALIRSFAAIQDFSEDLNNQSALYEAGALLDAWENDNNKGTFLPMLKDIVHPCQRLVQKLRMQNLDKEFSGIIAQEGFDLEEWAYTCDKTIKAYRALRMTKPELLTLLMYKRNIYQNLLYGYDEEIGPRVAATMQSMTEMYSAPVGDILEVKKNQEDIQKSFEGLKYRIASQPIVFK